MMEHGSAALLASQVVHLIPSLTETSLSSDQQWVWGWGYQGDCSGLLQGVLGNGPLYP